MCFRSIIVNTYNILQCSSLFSGTEGKPSLKVNVMHITLVLPATPMARCVSTAYGSSVWWFILADYRALVK